MTAAPLEKIYKFPTFFQDPDREPEGEPDCSTRRRNKQKQPG
jgi:hypothetical protein